MLVPSSCWMEWHSMMGIGMMQAPHCHIASVKICINSTYVGLLESNSGRMGPGSTDGFYYVRMAGLQGWVVASDKGHPDERIDVSCFRPPNAVRQGEVVVPSCLRQSAVRARQKSIMVWEPCCRLIHPYSRQLCFAKGLNFPGRLVKGLSSSSKMLGSCQSGPSIPHQQRSWDHFRHVSVSDESAATHSNSWFQHTVSSKKTTSSLQYVLVSQQMVNMPSAKPPFPQHNTPRASKTSCKVLRGVCSSFCCMCMSACAQFGWLQNWSR